MLYYMIPEYRDGHGSCCRVKDHNGEELHQHTLQVMLKRILSERGMELKALRRQCSKEIMQRNLIPLYMGDKEVLMPIKVREPRVKRDGGYGYVNAIVIKKIENTRIIMQDGTYIEFIESKRAVARRLKICQRLQQQMGRRPMGMTYVDMPAAGQTAATKEDMALIAYEVARLRKDLMGLMEEKG
jgi:hypothetical protein